MRICGLQKTTLLDYPGKVAATIFTPGCNFRCPFCHNMNLVEKAAELPCYTQEEILSFLRKRKGILDGVCITGGEPTLQTDVILFIRKVRELGYLIKLDTNGSRPEVIKELVGYGLLDYIAMDIKTAASEYSRVTNIPKLDITPVLESIDYLKQGYVGYEFRTTVVRQYHNAEVFDEIGEMLRGCKNYYLQSFAVSEYVPDQTLMSYNKEELSCFAEQLKKYDITAEIRGID